MSENKLDEKTKPEPCVDCGEVWYPSPNPERLGEWEHVCQKTQGVKFVEAGWPDSLKKTDVARFKEKKAREA